MNGKRTGVVGLVRVVLALVEPVVLLLFLDQRIGDVTLVIMLVSTGIADV